MGPFGVMTEYAVDLDDSRVSALMRIWGLEEPRQLVVALMDWTYHCYVVEEDEFVSGKEARKKVEDLEEELRRLRKRIEVIQNSKKTGALCPKCFSKATFDEVGHIFSCSSCGWEGPEDKVVRRSNSY